MILIALVILIKYFLIYYPVDKYEIKLKFRK